MTADLLPPGLPPRVVARRVLCHPWSLVIRRWNYKSAVVSALCRGPLFFAANLSAGPGAAVAAMGTEFVFRFATSGFYGALTQAFRSAEPARHAMLAAMLLLPALGHSAELAVHWARGTPRLGTSMAASIFFTCLTTAFNVFAMRRGALIVGEGSASLTHDLRRLPGLIGAFLVSWRSSPST